MRGGGAAAPTPVAQWLFNNTPTNFATNGGDDAVGGNDLSINGVVQNTTDYMEGSCSGDWESADGDDMSIADGSLDSGFPFKSGETNRDMTITFWHRAETLPSQNDIYIGKGDDGTDDANFEIWQDTADKINFSISADAGDTWEVVTHGTALTSEGGGAEWYFIAVVYDDSNSLGNGAYYYRIHVWQDDSTCSTVGSDLTGNFSGQANIESATLWIGEAAQGSSNIDGEMDDFRVYDSALTSAEIAAVKDETTGC